MKDPVAEIATSQLIEMAIDVQVQLERGSGTRPVLWLLQRSRTRAVDAIFALTKIDPAKAEDIRHLQNEISLYDDMIADCRELLNRGKEADRELDEQDRHTLAGLLTPEDAREAGIEQTAEDT